MRNYIVYFNCPVSGAESDITVRAIGEADAIDKARSELGSGIMIAAVCIKLEV